MPQSVPYIIISLHPKQKDDRKKRLEAEKMLKSVAWPLNENKRFESELIFVVRIHPDSSHDTCIINERVSSVSSAEGMLLSRIPQTLYVKNDTDTTVMTKRIRLAHKIEAKRQERWECDERGNFSKSSWECSFI